MSSIHVFLPIYIHQVAFIPILASAMLSGYILIPLIAHSGPVLTFSFRICHSNWVYSPNKLLFSPWYLNCCRNFHEITFIWFLYTHPRLELSYFDELYYFPFCVFYLQYTCIRCMAQGNFMWLKKSFTMWFKCWLSIKTTYKRSIKC